MKILSGPSPAIEKQVLLDRMLQDPKRSWLKYMDGPQSLRLCLLLYREEVAPTCKGKCGS